jgi:hypothetical protein
VCRSFAKRSPAQNAAATRNSNWQISDMRVLAGFRFVLPGLRWRPAAAAQSAMPSIATDPPSVPDFHQRRLWCKWRGPFG